MNHRVLGALSFGHFAVDLTAGALPATLPYLQNEFHLSYFWLGAIMTMSGITSSIMQPIFGIVSDVAKARYFLPLGVLGALIGFAAIGTAHNYAAVLAFVTVMGLGSAIYHPEASKCAYAVSGRLRTTGMSYFAVGGNLGVAFGPLVLTALLAWRGLPATWMFALPAIAVAMLVSSVIPAIAHAQVQAEHERDRQPPPARPWPLALLIGVGTLRSMVYGGVLAFVPLYAVNVLHKPAAQNGFLLFVFLAAGAAATLAAGRIADHYGARATMTASLALAPFALIMYLTSSGILAWIGLALSGAFLIGSFSTTVVLGQECMPNRVALASALMIGFTTGLGSLGVALIGEIADAIGLNAALWLLVLVAVGAFALALAFPNTRRIPGWARSRALAGHPEA
ncbi:MAG TPA: MFS transporter [Candidatus Eremiobacteraceae bacterium]|nr:MFS transporter [Candidatus Eremiobacteraceae bacterium]